ncbi:hypothetical protein V3C99_009941 [Haemonchus contortus]|nr:unnamed protein product [Haemonchus contortus]
MKRSAKFNTVMSDIQQSNKKPATSSVRSDYIITNQGHGYDDELRPMTKSSDYLMDQIHLEKRTPTEIKEELNREDLKPSPVDEPLRSVEPCPSEYQLAALNDQLSYVPMVKAFNELERKRKGM